MSAAADNPPETVPNAARETPRELRFALLIGLLCVVWSSTWWAIRICLEEQPPLSSAAVRFVLAGLAMAAVAPRLRKLENAPAPPTWLWLVFGLTNFAGGYGILYFAETVVPSGIAAVLWAIFPLLMAASAVTFLGERLSPRQWLGFGVSFAGVLSVLSSDLGGIAPDQLGYAWLVLLSPLVAAIGLTIVKKYGSSCSSVTLNRNGMLIGAAALLLCAFVREDPLALRWTPRVLIATGYLAIIGTAMTFAIYMWLLRTAPASMLSLINYITPVLAMLLGAAVGDGALDAFAWLGAALVTAGIALVVTKNRG
ncbi:MAG: DMT family transporter [Planctomycetota bacterium]